MHYRRQLTLLMGWTHHIFCKQMCVYCEASANTPTSRYLCYQPSSETRLGSSLSSWLMYGGAYIYIYIYPAQPLVDLHFVVQLPTFLLSFASLHPKFRSNVLFCVSFFLTRIAFNIVLCISCFLPWNRPEATGGSRGPSIILVAILPVHLTWFKGIVSE